MVECGTPGHPIVGPETSTISREMPRPIGAKALMTAQLAMAAIAVPSGIILLADPSGSLIGGRFVLPHLKAAIPFLNDFTLVGLWLLAVYGILPVVLMLGLLRHSRWAWRFSVLLGVVELGWITAELVLFYNLGFTPMYPLIGGIGLATLVVSLLPSVRQHYSSTEKIEARQ